MPTIILNNFNSDYLLLSIPYTLILFGQTFQNINKIGGYLFFHIDSDIFVLRQRYHIGVPVLLRRFCSTIKAEFVFILLSVSFYYAINSIR